MAVRTVSGDQSHWSAVRRTELPSLGRSRRVRLAAPRRTSRKVAGRSSVRQGLRRPSETPCEWGGWSILSIDPAKNTGAPPGM